jgi:hypothetical protein
MGIGGAKDQAEAMTLDETDGSDDDVEAKTSSCFKSSSKMAAATLASSSAISLEYNIAFFVLPLYIHANLHLLILS